MSLFKPFFYKELLKSIRNFNLLIILIVFGFFGFANPIIAKLTPELLNLAGADLGGKQITIPDPTAIDSWLQFFSNISTQLGLFILIFSSIFTSEIASGSIINIITKGMPRHLIITTKFGYLIAMWTVAYYLTFLITYIYTPLLLTGDIENLLLMSMFPYFYGILLIAISIFGGVVTKNTIGSIVFPLLYTILMSILGIIDAIDQFLPSALSKDSLLLITGEVGVGHFVIPLIVTFFVTVFFISSSIVVFNRQYL